MDCIREYLVVEIDTIRDVDELHIDEATIARAGIQAMRNHPDNSNVQVAACDALYYLCHHNAIITEEWPPVTILQAMNNHAQCAKVQMSTFIILSNLLENVAGDRVETRLRPVSGQHYVQAILHAMQNHSDNEAIQSNVLDVLEAMTIESSTFPHIIQGGGVELVIRATRMIKCIHSAIVILERLFKSSADARRIAIEGDAIPILLELLQTTSTTRALARYGNLPFLQVQVCAIVNYFLLENMESAVGQVLASEGVIERIVDVIAKDVFSFRQCHKLNDNDILAHLAMFSSSDGMLPLHYASCWCHASNEESRRVGRIAGRHTSYDKSQTDGQIAVVEHLLKVYPEAATIRDGSGRLPLDAAIDANAHFSVLEALLRINPAAGQAVWRHRSVACNFPPALMAAAKDCDLDSIFFLLCLNPTIMKRQGATTSKRKRKLPT